jgi:hypothetical protein
MEANVVVEAPYGRARLAALRYRAMLLSKSVEYAIQSGTRADEHIGSAVSLRYERTVSIHLSPKATRALDWCRRNMFGLSRRTRHLTGVCTGRSSLGPFRREYGCSRTGIRVPRNSFRRLLVSHRRIV